MGGDNLFDSLKDLVTKIVGIDEVHVDNMVFKLHRIGTVVLLLVFSVVISLGQVSKKESLKWLFVVISIMFRYNCPFTICNHVSFAKPSTLFFKYAGDPIECISAESDRKGIDSKLLDTYCWIHGTYTKENDNMELGKHYENASCDPDKEKCWHHTYYQFVVMVLVCQAACFYFPW